MRKNQYIGFISILIFSLVLGSIGSLQAATPKISIAQQYGLAYAPLEIMAELKLLEKHCPGVKIEWKQLGNTAAIREAMVAGQVDVGFMAIPPFLIGWDKGMNWRIMGGLSESPVGLITNQERIKSIKDFTLKDRIALPQPGSVQHILLAMACEREMGDAKKLDNLLVTLAHPEGMTALIAKTEISAHFTAPPYLFEELDTPGLHQILNGEEALGGKFTFIVGATTQQFHDKNFKIYRGFDKAIKEAMGYMKQNPDKTATILAGKYQSPKEAILRYLAKDGMVYTANVRGIQEFADFMVRNGYLSKKPKLKDILWDNVKYAK